MKKLLRNYFPLFLTAGVVIGLDQWAKFLVRANLAIGQAWMPWDWLAPYARVIHWKNTGAAFGMLQSFGGVFSVLAVVVAIAIIYYYPQAPRDDWPLRLALGMQMGGALGNLIDRLNIGWVTDFVSIGTFPVFNVADSSISVGVAVLILDILIRERRQKRRLSLPAEAVEPEAALLPEDGSE